MTVLIKIKGGKGSGWHAPPKGTHSAAKHVAVGSGRSGGGEVKSAAGIDNLFNAILDRNAHFSGANTAERTLAKEQIIRNVSSAEVSADDVSAIMSGWAQSSTKTADATSLQLAASQEFDIPMSEYVGKDVAWQAKASKLSPASPLYKSRTTVKTQRQALRTMYDDTQQALQEVGYGPSDKITLYRGMNLSMDSLSSGQREAISNIGSSIQVSGNPLESWSTDKFTAEGFAIPHTGTVGIVLKMDVPVKNIVSTARTGIGCLIEGEVVTMGSVAGQATVQDVSMRSPLMAELMANN